MPGYYLIASTSPAVAYDTSGQKFGTACLNGGYGNGTGIIAGGFPSLANFTLQVWFKRASAPAALENIYGMDNGGTTSIGLTMGTTGNLGASYFSGGANKALASATNYADGAWHLAELTGSAAGGQLFVDGVSKQTRVDVPDGNQGVNIAIGARARSFTGVFGGEIDAVSLWSIRLHTAGYTPPTSPWIGSETGLVALWNLDSVLTDSSFSVTGIGAITQFIPVLGARKPGVSSARPHWR